MLICANLIVLFWLQVKFMIQLRKDLAEDFRHGIATDDITQQLISSADPGALMAAELAKHEAAGAAVQKNIDSQDKLLPALIEANAAHAGSRQNRTSLYEQREAFVHGLLSDYDAFRDMQLRVQNGTAFYESFAQSLRGIKQRIGAQAAATRPLSPSGTGSPVSPVNPFAAPVVASAPPIPTAPKPAGASTFLRRNQSTAALRPISSGSPKLQKSKSIGRRLSIANPFDAGKTAAAAEASLRGGDFNDAGRPFGGHMEGFATFEEEEPLPPVSGSNQLQRRSGRFLSV